MILKRKIYKDLLNWKETCNGNKALLIEGARRIGKSTIAEEFGKKEYKSYILIDFNDVSDTVINLFTNYLQDLDTFFLILKTEYNITLYERESLIIFDEIQMFPKARQSIKKLVKDGRFDYIETGSLISIKENVRDITIPSEERKINMYPLSFEEFCIALKQESIITYIRECYIKEMPLEKNLHEKAMLLFRQYMIVGGMPQSIIAYINNNFSFYHSDLEKRDILNLYRNDIMKINSSNKVKIISIFDQIPAFLSKSEKRVILSEISSDSNFEKYSDSFFWLSDSKIVNDCFNCSDPNISLTLNESRTYIKCYMSDTGLLLSHTFNESEIDKEELYKELLLGNISINEGMFFENVIAQILTYNGYKLFYYNHYCNIKKRNDMEIDFIISNNSKTKFKIFPIEVKSSTKYQFNSLKKFNDKFKDRIGVSYIIHPKNYIKEDNMIRIPVYMAFCL